MAEADHAGAYKQKPVAEEDEFAAAAMLGIPSDQLLFGSVPNAELLLSSAAVLHCNRLLRVMATLA